MVDILSVLANIMQIVGLPVAIWALFFARRQLKQAVSTDQFQNVFTIDELLSPFEEVRTQLNRAEPVDEARLAGYIAAFDRVGNVVKNKGITLELADGYYGPRFARLINYPPARRIVEDRPAGKQDFIYLWEKLHGYKGNKWGLPELPTKQLTLGS